MIKNNEYRSNFFKILSPFLAGGLIAYILYLPTRKIEKIIEAGLWAPSAHNHQSWSFVVIENKDIIEELNVDTKNVMKNYKIEQFRKWGENEKFNIFYNSPVVILVLYDENGLVPMQDISVASQNMLLTAHTLGLGTCWIGMVSIGFSDESMQQKYKEKLEDKFL